MKKVSFQASLPVTFLREGDQFVAYTPALDLSTSGSTFEQAKKRFNEIVQIFFEECFSMGTLEQVLSINNYDFRDTQKPFLRNSTEI